MVTRKKKRQYEAVVQERAGPQSSRPRTKWRGAKGVLALAAFSETTVRSQGKLWQRVQVQLLMRHGKSRLFLVQSCVVIRFAVRLLLSVTFSRLRGKGRARYSLVVWCRPSRRNLGNTSEVARGKYRTSRLDASSQRHQEQAIVRRVYRASPEKKGLQKKQATRPIKLGKYALDFSEFERNLGNSQVKSVSCNFCLFLFSDKPLTIEQPRCCNFWSCSRGQPPSEFDTCLSHVRGYAW